ncbi:MAG TPA: alpha/beta hydrolase [Rhizomicrobium sp.]
MRLVGRIAKWLGLGVLALIVLGVIYQQIGAAIDDATVPPDGRIVEVGGHGVHVVCSGAGRRTYVLDAGLGAWSFEWYRLQPVLARSGRVCAFDRPGYGTSEAIAHAYDGVTAADELHALLPAAGISTPFVYVGHSLGANFAEIYGARYPRDVEALVLIEPGAPSDLLGNFDPISRPAALAMPATCGAACTAAWAAGYLGVPRFIVHFIFTGAGSMGGDPDTLARYHAGASRSSAGAAGIAYFAALPKTCFQVSDIAGFGALPVLIFASSIAPPSDPGEDMVKWRRGQLAYFAALAAKSQNGEGPVTLEGSSHASMVMGEKPVRQLADRIARFLARLHPAP